MPAWDKNIDTWDGILNISNFSVVRLAEQTYARGAYLLIAGTCIKRDS
jgi:hypothetical protein